IALPASAVQPMVALSVVYVALESVVASDHKPWRLPLVFGFGLLHGVGLAARFHQVAWPASQFAARLAAFNAGVGAGQLAALLFAVLIVGSWVRQHEAYRRLVVMPASAALALTGFFWTIQSVLFG